MDTITALFSSRRASLFTGIAMACLWGVFASAHVLAFLRGGDWSYLLFCAAETLAALFFIVRSAPVSVSTDAGDWLLAIGATFAPFFFAPSDLTIWPGARYLLAIGSLLQMAGLLSLNRSFGLVAAQRDIKTGGLYRVVRHPVYASYLISSSAYLLTNTSPMNGAVYVLAMLMLVARLLREERFLAADVRYRVYMRQVKYRLLPFIF
ncbi:MULTISPECIES: isoprenylcysteine carboxylmethyltransferase family protein [unclassified Janthinobacterium]|uniref:methyltransferase family protein n=1 Tax=unclassified Janthinobacterium TaxID=2610881 RepID=UPI000889B427|nr:MULTISPECIES: methyltransferase [unclassified Janthinobacterium]SDA44194.1 Protein-S-isoprenylcysteine O-methyltransferase Ste14 [Janthinobacterium sp. 551a]SFA93271.1 Protein-S-isoprenylcysteine O-methyltransferase Ste14 [Janthinobacterium sp. 344]